MNRFFKAVSLISALCSLSLLFAACKSEQEDLITDKAFYDYYNSYTEAGTEINNVFVKQEVDSKEIEDFVPSDKESDYVLIRIKNFGSIVVVLRSDVAPITVANFKKLVKEKFYEGTAFHRIINHFMIQGGGSTIKSEIDEHGRPGDVFVAKESGQIRGEFELNGFENNLRHVRGVISMARTDKYDSASAQFFIIHESNESSANLNGGYASFGYVLAGMDVVDTIANLSVFGDSDSPIPYDNVIIEEVSFVEPKAALW